MTPSPVQLVLNPQAGNGRALAMARRLESELTGHGHQVRTHVLRDLAEAARWTQECRGEFGYLFCIGGDRTINAVAPAAMRLRVPLIPIPAGFGNTFARALGHRERRGGWHRLLQVGEVQWVDVGIERQGAFLCNRGHGLLERVDEGAEQRARRPTLAPLRYLAYFRSALRILRNEPLPAVRVQVDGEPLAARAALVIVANVQTYQGFLNLTPAASPMDGLLDVVAASPQSKLQLLSLLLAFLLHLPGRADLIRYRRGTRVSMVADGQGPEELGILPGALPVLVPR